MLGASIIIGMFIVIAVLAWNVGKSRVIAKSAEDFADRTHQRLNGFFNLFSTEKLCTMKTNLDILMHDVMGANRSGIYPDMGLRDWCRAWREKLRTTDALHARRITGLEMELAALKGLPEVQKAIKAQAARLAKEAAKREKAYEQQARKLRKAGRSVVVRNGEVV